MRGLTHLHHPPTLLFRLPGITLLATPALSFPAFVSWQPPLKGGGFASTEFSRCWQTLRHDARAAIRLALETLDEWDGAGLLHDPDTIALRTMLEKASSIEEFDDLEAFMGEITVFAVEHVRRMAADGALAN